MSIRLNVLNTNTVVECEEGTTIETILKKVEKDLKYPAIIAKYDNAYRALTHEVHHDGTLEFLDLSNQEAGLVYQNSLVLIFIKAVHDVCGKKVLITVNNALNKGLYITLTTKVNSQLVEDVLKRMHELVDEDIIIKKEHMTKDAAQKLAIKLKQKETFEMLHSITNIDDVEIYSLEDETQIFYNQMVPSTGYITLFDIKIYHNGLILRYPHAGDPGKVAEYEEQKKMYDAYSEATKWGQLMETNFVTDLNERIIYENLDDLFLMQEALHEKRISDIADMIVERKARVVLICGPSSSGKTTFAKRLCIHLGVNGFKTLYLGTDDYYKEKSERVYDENGEPDLESIRAIDVSLFGRNIRDLLDGKEVDLPKFDFGKTMKVYGQRVTKLEKNQLVVIEGIHAMNDLLLAEISDAEKFKIYISPFTPISIDHHNRISATDARMLRRLVRDYKFRNSDARDTIKSWPKVRRSEDVNIFPFISKADVFFNSNCIYELAVLKKYAEHLLKRVRREEPEYAEAQRMLAFLKYFDCIYDESRIPNNSIIREFIGGSVIVK